MRQRHHGLGDEVWFVCLPDVAEAYRRLVKPGEAPYVRVMEWKASYYDGLPGGQRRLRPRRKPA